MGLLLREHGRLGGFEGTHGVDERMIKGYLKFGLDSLRKLEAE